MLLWLLDLHRKVCGLCRPLHLRPFQTMSTSPLVRRLAASVSDARLPRYRFIVMLGRRIPRIVGAVFPHRSGRRTRRKSRNHVPPLSQIDSMTAVPVNLVLRVAKLFCHLLIVARIQLAPTHPFDHRPPKYARVRYWSCRFRRHACCQRSPRQRPPGPRTREVRRECGKVARPWRRSPLRFARRTRVTFGRSSQGGRCEFRCTFSRTLNRVTDLGCIIP